MNKIKQNGLNSAEYIKTLLIDHLLFSNKEAIIGNEVMYGINKRMADIVLLQNYTITAIEIKAKNDSFRRIQEQVKDYKTIFKFIYLCVTENHLTKALTEVSKDIGIIVVYEDERVELLREAKVQNKNIKSAMLFTINTSFLKSIDNSTKKLKADEVRKVFMQKKPEDVQRMLFDFLKSKTENKFEIFLSERGERTHIEDVFLLSLPKITIF